MFLSHFRINMSKTVLLPTPSLLRSVRHSHSLWVTSTSTQLSRPFTNSLMPLHHEAPSPFPGNTISIFLGLLVSHPPFCHCLGAVSRCIYLCIYLLQILYRFLPPSSWLICHPVARVLFLKWKFQHFLLQLTILEGLTLAPTVARSVSGTLIALCMVSASSLIAFSYSFSMLWLHAWGVLW